MRNQSYRPSQRTDFCRAYLPRFPLNQVRPVSVSETRSCDQGIVDLWYYFYEDADAELLASHRALLTPDELERHSSLRFERDRLLFLATRALVRTVLSNYAAVSAADWRFTADDRGKPRIVAPVVMPAIHFNLTNTLGLVVCAVSVAHELVGVDAERTDREVEAVALADRFFSPSEASRLEGLAAAERSELFFSYWTLKESYIKARGLGLTLPLRQFSFRLDDEIGIEFDEGFDDEASSWRFALLNAPPHLKMAVSVKTAGAALSLRASRVVPLRGRCGRPVLLRSENTAKWLDQEIPTVQR